MPKTEFAGVIRFPQLLERVRREREIIAWFSETGRDITVAEFETLQRAYGSALEIEHRGGKPLLRYRFVPLSSDHARREAYRLQDLIRKQLGLMLMLQPEETHPNRT